MLEIRRFEQNDVQAVVALLKLTFQGWHSVDFWKWKYLMNPAGFDRNIWIAKDADRVVGYYAIIPTAMKVGNREVLGAQSVDTATHPSYRGRGIFVDLATHVLQEASKTEISMVYGFPGAQSYGGFIKLGFKRICEVPKMMAVMNPPALNAMRWRDAASAPRALWKYLRRLPQSEDEQDLLDRFRDTYSDIEAFVRFGLRVARVESLRGDGPIRLVTRFDHRYESLWTSISHRYDIAVCRGTDYLNWRYFQNPEERYLVVAFEDREEILGYAVLTTTYAEGTLTGYIVDMVGTEGEVIESLLGFALRYFSSVGAGIVIAWEPCEADHLSAFKKVGFFPAHLGKLLPTRLALSVIALATSIDASELVASSSTRWQFAMGDSDWI